MTGSQPITLTRYEIEALHAYMLSQESQALTYRVQRDTRHVLLVIEPSGHLVRLSP